MASTEQLMLSAVSAYAVTPGTSPLTKPSRLIVINVGGVLQYTGWDGVDYTTAALPAGAYPIFATHILAVGTTATGITAFA